MLLLLLLLLSIIQLATFQILCMGRLLIGPTLALLFMLSSRAYHICITIPIQIQLNMLPILITITNDNSIKYHYS